MLLTNLVCNTTNEFKRICAITHTDYNTLLQRKYSVWGKILDTLPFNKASGDLGQGILGSCPHNNSNVMTPLGLG